MRILTALTYYRPHISGLTIYTERLAKALVNLGHDVTILTSQFDPQTPYEEIRDGVRIVRVPVLFRISKGVIMPTIGIHATKLVKDNDVVHLHLPQFDAAGIALRGRIYKKPTVLTYHCDLKLPPGIFNRVANNAVHVMNHIAAKSAHRIVTYTDDFARHSPYTARYYDKVETILPPVILPDTTEEDIHHFASQNNHDARSPVIGMAARFAAEKGVEVLLEALPKVLQAYPNALVLYAGQYEDVMGEEEYANRLFPIVKEYQAKGQWRFLGVLNPPQMAEFYPNLDVLVVPSLNSTESFGLVQIEAMMNGVPVVASNLPGVRQPVSITKMGRIFNIGDAEGLAMALLSILQESEKYSGDPEAITIQFSPSNNAKAYEDLYKKILMEIH
ncbi:MAG: glycosyltransferase family 4 protein [Anaerolineales bacterium]|nr:glycosyltransferase family 4 protein [Anaerolineales bacterium]